MSQRWPGSTGPAVADRPEGRLLSGGGVGGLLGGVVGVIDGLVDAAVIGDLVAVLLRPGADFPPSPIVTAFTGTATVTMTFISEILLLRSAPFAPNQAIQAAADSAG
jgi:hypothetical protein